MYSVKRLLLSVGSLAALLAFTACTQTASPAAAPTESALFALPGGLSVQSTSLSDWAFAQGYSVEVKGVGLGAESTLVPACDCVTATLDIDNPDSVAMVYAQVAIKGKKDGPKTELPDSVSVESTSEKTWTQDPSDVNTLSQSFVNPKGQGDLTDGGQVYEGVFKNVGATIAATVKGVSTYNSKKNSEFYQPRAFIIYIFRKADTRVSAGMTPNYYLYWKQGYVTATETVTLPKGFAGGDVDVTFAISDLQMDDRTVILSASAGDETPTTATFSKPNEGSELLLHTITLTGVPAGTTTITATVTSPSGPKDSTAGDSVYWNGLNVSIGVAPPPPPPSNGVGRFTGGGFVRVEGVKYSFGLTLHCDNDLSNNFEINWGKGRNSNQWHLEKESLTNILCYDSDPEQAPPVAPLDTLEAEARGTLNHEDGSIIRFKIVDGGEPGRKDYIMVKIWEPGDDPDTDEPFVSFEGHLDGGNLQAHYDQPHGSKGK